jgi:hypothetical protein
MYREATAYISSAARMFGPWWGKGKRLTRPAPLLTKWYARVDPLVRTVLQTDGTKLSPAGILACMWASAMQAGLALKESGSPLFSIRYEELNRDPKAALAALFEFCGLDSRVDLDPVIAQDSQVGTRISRGRLNRLNRDLSELEISSLRGHLSQVASMTPELCIPGTFMMNTLRST